MSLRDQFEEDCSGRSFRIIPAKREDKTKAEDANKSEQTENNNSKDEE